MEKKIGFIGLGVMGHSMCRHIMDAGYSMNIYSRTRAKAEDLIAMGAEWFDAPCKVAEASDIVFTIVGYPKDVEEVYLGRNGLAEKAHAGQVFCDMTTTKPSLDIRIAGVLEQKGALFADAPVSGGDVGARNATLSIMAGGSDEAIETLMPLFRLMGKSITHIGKVGAGQHTKMCNQIVIAGTMAGVSEALVYGAKAGLDMEKMVATISKGAAGCWTLDNLAPRVLRKDYDPGFMVDHFIKDMRIALEEADSMDLALPSLSLTKELYTALKAQGYGRNGTQALVKALESLSGDSSL
ncbi:MAG: NAD(P)-dependent oxidoreductase [Candidatus Ornithospirochaeta sp.]|nr:NAD(P)-dependent oxidoreductase [Candidatus Ornithospirochaeta sp.]